MRAANEFQNVRWRFKPTADQRRDKATRGRSRMERVKRFNSPLDELAVAHASTIHQIKLQQWYEWSSGIGDIEGKVARVATSERG